MADVSHPTVLLPTRSVPAESLDVTFHGVAMLCGAAITVEAVAAALVSANEFFLADCRTLSPKLVAASPLRAH
jgi:hypothetical protein